MEVSEILMAFVVFGAALSITAISFFWVKSLNKDKPDKNWLGI